MNAQIDKLVDIALAAPYCSITVGQTLPTGKRREIIRAAIEAIAPLLAAQPDGQVGTSSTWDGRSISDTTQPATTHDQLNAANARIAELTAAVIQYQQHTISWANDLDAANQALIPDQELCRFYQVSSYPELVAAQQKHIEKLQERVRNVEPKVDCRVRIPREG